jgi:tubulin polyglutamylase TTLL4
VLKQSRRNILDVFTPDDLRILIETEDEYSRRGSFERIFPTNQTRKYLKYFDTPRYYNLLLNEWIAKYNRMEERGIKRNFD